MQAVSGAGYPGVASLDIMDNVVPYISGEDDKVAPHSHPLGAKRSQRGTLTVACYKVKKLCTPPSAGNGAAQDPGSTVGERRTV